MNYEVEGSLGGCEQSLDSFVQTGRVKDSQTTGQNGLTDSCIHPHMRQSLLASHYCFRAIIALFPQYAALIPTGSKKSTGGQGD